MIASVSTNSATVRRPISWLIRLTDSTIARSTGSVVISRTKLPSILTKSTGSFFR